ncbi:DUF5990 family protein [Xenorhabdus bovienii]|uniref:DUF5990 family protein n=1 Tax=Xenorhabdus bovienii TaxID=40576 RepID=UPI0023B31F7E|nr:DUF5990 family protein [Xenorhabdus bovienii]MDE9545414.1 DUF5990 family protein [Xenorhabdus bovienii]
MTENKHVEINLRILTGKAPAVHRNRPTLFGLQEEEKVLLHSGKELNGLLAFDTKVRVKDVDGMARCFGSQIHGSGATKHLYITWRFEDGEQEIINRLKVALLISWPLVEQSLRQNTPLVTDGSAPEWGVLKDWHALGVGEHWAMLNN